MRNQLKSSFITPSHALQAHAPQVFSPTDSTLELPALLDVLREEKASFKESLLKHGALLFRNCPIRNADDFSSVIEALGLGGFINYIGGDSPRTKVTEHVYTSTETPPSMHLPLHNELSYVKHYPGHIYFYCAIAPVDRGETIIGDCRAIYQAIDLSVRERFMEKGLRYTSRYPYKDDWMHKLNKSHKSWIHVFETENKQEVEEKCAAHDIAFPWHRNDWLEISQVRPAVMAHPETNESVWFNQAHHFDFNPKFLGLWRYLGAKLFYCRKHTLLHDISYGDETPIARQDLYHVMDALENNTISFAWQKGDVLVLDNILMMHGRAPFTGPRRVLTAMTA
jgi:alpha-ketoglutarate-dependent taurine dioxygenase